MMNSKAPDTGLEPRIRALDQQIQAWRIAYRRFFAGALDIPPESDKDAITRALRDLRSINQQSPVERFKISNLEAQFNSYSEMFQRRLREVEEGYRPARLRDGEDSAPRFDVETGVVLERQPDPEAVDALFHGLTARGSKLELDTFRSYLDKQMDGIRKKTGCSSVQFRLVSEGGKVKLKAKPMGVVARPNRE